MISSGCTGPVDSVRSVDRHEALVEIDPDGSVVVTERLDGQLFGQGASFERVIAGRRADGIEYAGSSIDGVNWIDTAGESLRVVADGGRRLHVRWTWGGPAPAPTSLSWRYRLTGAIGLRDQRGVFMWPILASPRGLSVRSSRIELRLPEGVSTLRGTGMAETGWDVELQPRGMTASRDDLGLSPATLLVEFPVDTRRVSLPVWQVNEDLQGEFAPAFVSAAIFMVVIGVGVIWIVRLQHPSIRIRDSQPAAIPPSMSAAALRILRRGTARGAGHTIRELTGVGLIDPERLSVARGLRTTAWVGALVALACAAIGHVVLWRFGWWPQIVPASMIAMALLFLLFAGWFRVLTAEGERLRAALRRRG